MLACAVAVLLYVPQLAKLVLLVTWTVIEPPAAKVAVPLEGQLSVLLVIVHVGDPLCEAMDHEMPLPVGSGSETEKPVAAPWPVLVTVIVNPIGDPALTLAASAVLVMCRLGHCTVVCAVAGEGAVPFVKLTVAVLLYVPQLANAVGLVM